MLTETEIAQAVLYGIACGDALGGPVEFLSLAEIKGRYGPQGIRDLGRPAEYTDDTQLTLALARGLIAKGDADLETLMGAVAEQFIAWRITQDDPAQQKAPGRAVLAATGYLRDGRSWHESGIPNAKGCGAVMRVAPVGYLYQHDLARLQAVASASGIATHRHPASDAATIGAAYLVKLALDGMEPIEMPYRLVELVGDISKEVAVAVGRVLQVIDWPHEETAMRKLGQGWVADEALALALYCFLRYPDSYADCVIRGANIDGDSDSVACIAGAIVAARLAGQGKFPVPTDWVARIQDSDEIARIGMDLAAVKARLGGGG